MWNRLLNWSKQPQSSARTASDRRARRLVLEQFEARTMMAGIPALSSLPGAAQTIYLDFNGDFQSVWNRTDSGQTYRNVNVGEFNIDNQAGISDAEAAAIRKIWETVADDYAPFNVNVTTVEPPSFANGAAIRVVMAGDISAIWQKDANTQVTINDDVFIVDSSGNKVDTSGYAALDSYTNAEPNVVYVFAKYMSTWNMVDSEGHSRDLRAIIATTATHEAGHAFGLEHHGNYDVGSGITTPIMGGNVQGDRTIWSQYQVGTETHNNLAQLTALFGARADDFGGNYQSGANFAFTTYSPLRGWQGSVQGIIGTGGDTDMFRLTVSSASTYNINVAVPQFGNLDSRLVLYRVHQIPLFGYYYETIATVDPGISSITPFQGLGASLSKYLQA
ncbi:MAG: hypothetical protein MUF06_24275, partial [Pirellulaceae bacterium]|nr:hypothetical protein [Pirellulaceae bacterium]